VYAPAAALPFCADSVANRMTLPDCAPIVLPAINFGVRRVSFETHLQSGTTLIAN
jgi:hypothetical protein